MSQPISHDDAAGPDRPAESGLPQVGDELLLDVGPVAHGGHCVARFTPAGAEAPVVVFVRHALPGERVRAQITDVERSFLRADAVDVLVAAPGRVVPPCPFAGPGRCGGCDWQHADLATQRALKADVIAEQFRRLAGLDVEVTVEALPDVPGAAGPGLGWRTRMQWAVRPDGGVGLRRHRSHDVEPVDECLLAHPAVDAIGVSRSRWPGAAVIEAQVADAGGEREETAVVVAGRPGRRVDVPIAHPVTFRRPGQPVTRRLVEYACDRLWQVSAGGFWQVHPAAAETLADAVLRALRPRRGDVALDLYAGVGLFAGVLADEVGPDGEVFAVEGDPGAVADARRNVGATVTVIGGDVARSLATGSAPAARTAPDTDSRAMPPRGRPTRGSGPRGPRGGGRVDPRVGGAPADRGGSRRPGPAVPDRVDLVVLDPPRAGAGATVVHAITSRRPRAVAYVSCDPATLARDVATFAKDGYRLAGLRAFDAFPMTAHVECVARFVRA